MKKQGYKDMVDTICQLTKDTPNNMELGKTIRSYINNLKETDTYIYESPDGGKTMYRRKIGDYSNRELLNDQKKIRSITNYIMV